MPGFQLSIGLKLKRRLLVLDLLTELFDILLNLGFETSPVGFQLTLRVRPDSVVSFRLLLHGVPELVTLLAPVGESLVGLDAEVGIRGSSRTTLVASCFAGNAQNLSI
jgi:hypothetical protein